MQKGYAGWILLNRMTWNESVIEQNTSGQSMLYVQ